MSASQERSEDGEGGRRREENRHDTGLSQARHTMAHNTKKGLTHTTKEGLTITYQNEYSRTARWGGLISLARHAFTARD